MSVQPSESPDGKLAALRAEVARCDSALLEAVNERIRLVAEVRLHKQATGVPFVDPAQEARLLAALVAANAGRLSDAGVRELFAVVLGLTKREVARSALRLPPEPGSDTL